MPMKGPAVKNDLWHLSVSAQAIPPTLKPESSDSWSGWFWCQCIRVGAIIGLSLLCLTSLFRMRYAQFDLLHLYLHVLSFVTQSPFLLRDQPFQFFTCQGHPESLDKSLGPARTASSSTVPDTHRGGLIPLGSGLVVFNNEYLSLLL